MLDLKAKLAAAGLVSQADVAAAERKGRTGPKGQDRKASPPDRRGDRPDNRQRQQPQAQPQKPLLDVAALQRAGKGEAYDAIRRVVDRLRLDPAHGIPGEHAEPFHFTTAAGNLSRLTLDPPVRDQVTAGTAGIIAFMSHHGLAHCVVPRALAGAVYAVFPTWLRVLKDHPGAGQLAPRPEPKADPKPATASAEPAEPAASPASEPTASAEPAAETTSTD